MFETHALVDAGMLLGCPHRLALDTTARRAGLTPVDTPGSRQRKDAAAAHRLRVHDLIVGDEWAVIDADRPVAARAEATLAACAEEAGWVWGATLPVEPDTGRSGAAEILVHDPERGGYLPIIVVNHKVADPRRPEPVDEPAVTSELRRWDPRAQLLLRARGVPRDTLRLAHVYRMLQRHGLAGPALQGGIIGSTADCIVVHDLGRVLDDYDRRFGERISIVRGEAATSPSRIPECRNCPWWSNDRAERTDGCREVLQRRRDVSLVVSGVRAEVLRRVGAETVDDLARWEGAAPDDWPTNPGNDFADVLVAARAWLRGVLLVRRAATVRVHRADVEVDIDLESFGEDGVYLWGTLLDGRYRPFVTWDPLPTPEGARIFAEFWSWLTQVRAGARAAGKTFAAYCYTRTEDKWMVELAHRYKGVGGVPTVEEVRELITGREWVDLFGVVTEQFICPSGKGLKALAPVAGFGWRDPQASGEASMGWYRAAVGYDGDSPDTGQRMRLLDYNEDDVRATAALRGWLTDRAEYDSPLASQLQLEFGR